MTLVPMVKKPVHWFADWFLYGRDLCHERVKGYNIKEKKIYKICKKGNLGPYQTSTI